MKGKKIVLAVILITAMCTCFILSSVTALAGTTSLKEGMSGSAVAVLQSNLKSLGYLNVNPTGYYGKATVAAVKKLQAKYGLEQDGIAGAATQAIIQKLMAKKSSTVSRGDVDRSSYLLPWFGSVDEIFQRGTTATIYDIATGLSFKIKRTYGENHADCETLTAKDTATMKKIYGGEWSWNRRAIIVTVNGKKIAASMAGMPHAGVDKLAADTYVNSRSGGYGSGTNLDTVKGNGMSGVFDVHFLGSKTHATNHVDDEHQAAIQKAANWAEKNY